MKMVGVDGKMLSSRKFLFPEIIYPAANGFPTKKTKKPHPKVRPFLNTARLYRLKKSVRINLGVL